MEHAPMEEEKGPGGEGRRGLLRALLGVALSFGAFGALLLWAWRLGTRDVSELPVITRPEIQAIQEAPERPPPEEAQDDAARSRFSVIENPQGEASGPESDGGAALSALRETEAPAEALIAARPIAPRPSPPAERTVERITESSPLPDARPLASEKAQAPLARRPFVPPARRPPRPARPAASRDEGADRVAARTAEPPPPAESGGKEAAQPTPAPSPPDPKSALQIQLGAFSSKAVAQARWKTLRAAHADLLSNLAAEFPRAVVNARIYYRLRVGPVTERERGAAICAALEKRKVDCLLVRRRTP